MSIRTAGNLLDRLEIGIGGMLGSKFVYEGAFSGVDPATIWKARAARIVLYLHVWIDSKLCTFNCAYLLMSLITVRDLHTLRIFRFFEVVYYLNFFIVSD